MNFKDYIRVIPDFPQPGIRFKDITTLLKDAEAYRKAVEAIADQVRHLNIDLIAGPEARGFVVGAPLALMLGVGFVPIRKSGKLPGETVETSYDLEYGSDKLAIHKDAIQPGQRVLVADDLLATDAEVREILAAVPPESRLLITDHAAFGYFARTYDFEVLGVVVPGGSTLAEPSSAELAGLAQIIRDTGVRAIFANKADTTALVDALAAEVGQVEVVELYVGTLGPEGSGAEDYATMMLTNARLIAAALSE